MDMDWIPFVSQLKSFVQLLFCDLSGAKKTQENFSKLCPIISQIRSAIEACSGDCESARQTQETFIEFMGLLLNTVLFAGQIKALVHYLRGKYEKADQAMKASSRTVGVAGGAVAGWFFGGILAAISGAVLGGLFFDVFTTVFDSYVCDEFKPNGLLLIANKVRWDVGHRAGHVFDFVGSVVLDGRV